MAKISDTLVSLADIKEIVNELSESDVVRYEGALCTQKSLIDPQSEISVLECKIAFSKKDEDRGD